MRLYIDSCVFIRATEGVDEVAQKLVELLDLAEPGARLELITSSITFAEVMTGPLKRLHADRSDRDAERVAAIYSSLLSGRVPSAGETARIEVIDVQSGICLNAADLRARRASLRLPDAIHLGTATYSQCDAILSNDDRLRVAVRESNLDAFSFELSELDALLASVSTT